MSRQTQLYTKCQVNITREERKVWKTKLLQREIIQVKVGQTRQH